MNNGPSFFWHDYETFGADPRRDRPAQFAGQRTNSELEPVGEPLVIYCKPALDVLPRPVSCLVTGITPQQADRDGVIEAEFAARMHDEFSVAGTCCVGYNSMRFDDEFTRNLLYRNFYDPYAREWENKNSRWDVIDLARMCYALRPHGIEWPMRDVEGRGRMPSFRLEDLTAANNLAHRRAHDALSDVQAPIALARLLRSRQPRLFDFYFALRRKQRACELLDFAHRTPVLHVSSRYPAERGCLAMVVPLAQHPTQPNKIIVYDLDADPTPLLTLDADEIADRVFTPRADLPEGVERIPLKAVSVNRAPALAPLSVLAGVDTARIGLDRERCLAHLELLRKAADLPDKLRQVFATPQEMRLSTRSSRSIADLPTMATGNCCAACARLLRLCLVNNRSRSATHATPNCCSVTVRAIGRNHLRWTSANAGSSSAFGVCASTATCRTLRSTSISPKLHNCARSTRQTRTRRRCSTHSSNGVVTSLKVEHGRKDRVRHRRHFPFPARTGAQQQSRMVRGEQGALREDHARSVPAPDR